MFLKMIATGRPPTAAAGVRADREHSRKATSARRGKPTGRPALLQAPPAALSELLGGRGVHPETVLLCTQTDIDDAGHYRPQWLVVTTDYLFVCTQDATPQVRVELKLSDVSEFRCEGVIGCGLLQARVDGVYIDLLRYSNAHADRFNKAARKLDRFLRGEPINLDEEDEADPRRCKGCGLMLDFAGEACPRCVNKGAVLARMWKLMLPYRKMAAATMALLVFGVSLDLVIPRLTQYLIDHVLPAGTGSHVAGLHTLLNIVIILAAVQVVRMLVNIANGRLGSRIATGITFDMRSRLVKHLQQLSVSYHDRQQVGSLVARVTGDTEALAGFVAQITSGFLFQIILVVLAAAMMLSLDVKLALWTLVPAPLVVMGTIIFWRYIYPKYYRLWDASTKQAGMLSGMLSGVRVVKSFGQEHRETDRFDEASAYLTQSRRRMDMSMSTFNPLMGLVFQLGGWIVWYVGGRDVLGGRMTLGGLMAFFGYMGMFYSPLGALTQFTNWLTSFVTQAHRIFEILDAPVEIVETEKPIVRRLEGGITFEQVTFGYNRHHQVLKDIDLDIKPGEMIGIVGRSGSGKSTIVNLICRFYDVNEGRVLMDGTDVRHFEKDNLRSQIGVVLQDPFLFRGSIAENVAYGKPAASPEEIITAAKAGNCHDFILSRPHAYDTWVGERGAGLSGGERQRISIARVLLTDPRILILDEATSSVDAESEAAIQSAMAEVVKGRTTIAIAHRLSTLRNADRILVLDQGRIMEAGSHEQLLARDGLYARLVRIQGEFSPAPTIDHLDAEVRWNGHGDRPQAAYVPRWLTPDRVAVEPLSHGALRMVIDHSTFDGLFAVRCMPVKYPRQYISLRYLNHERRETELGLVRDLDEWPKEAQELIERSLRRRSFVHTITAVNRIEHFQGYLTFDIESDLGPRRFMMRWQAEKAIDYGPLGKMLADTDDNRYLVPDVESLPERDRSLFLRYIYW